MTVLTLAQITEASTKAIPCASLGGSITIRRISSAEVRRVAPPSLEPIEGEPADAREARLTEWEKRHADAIPETWVQLVALASIEPKLTVEQARLLGDEAGTLATEIMAFKRELDAKGTPAADASA